jgi:hypothetical protein
MLWQPDDERNVAEKGKRQSTRTRDLLRDLLRDRPGAPRAGVLGAEALRILAPRFAAKNKL